MGKKLDALLGRTFKTAKFKGLASLAISRLAVFKNQRGVKCKQARSDVAQLLEQGHHERALLRVEQVMKEQNMLDAYVMMEGYINLLMERLHLLEQEKECPEEVKEAISTLLFASSRCGDFPELREIRDIFTSRYGKEFAARAIELRNNCSVNHKMIQKLSTRQPDLENRMKVLRELAAENNTVLQLEEDSSSASKEKLESGKKQDQPDPEKPTGSGSKDDVDNFQHILDEGRKEGLSESMKARKYTDVADAAQAAFESAAHAAAAARAAVELSRTYPHDPSNQNSPKNDTQTKLTKRGMPVKVEPGSENQEMPEYEEEKFKGEQLAEQQRSKSTSSSDSAEDGLKVIIMSSDEEDPIKLLDKDVVFDDSEDETPGQGFNVESGEPKGVALATEKSTKQIPLNLQTGVNVHPSHGYSTVHTAEGSESSKHLNLGKGPFSVRRRGVRGF
ncbi:hypothetical protein Tsubulata_018588 [Turnera subulata]|uniref:IST1-like protein n=1 Tax=Turnera subulata TaxID=218843 RepID=A0A9Q0G4U5_9ROSI|nr:hypothetical protein Tsubulata_018588 [Turnera subulata]